jgi:hypothetical protein
MVCKDGVVLAADRRATMGNLIADKKAQKIFQISDYIALTIAGTVSDIQLLTKLIKAELKLRTLRTGKINTVKEAVNLLSNMVYNNIRKFSLIPGISHFIEHLVFKGTKNRSVTEIPKAIEDRGGIINAFTGEEITAYWNKLPSKYFELGDFLPTVQNLFQNLILGQDAIIT